ncbi:MAG: DMT family transporter [Pseudomonadota bacterium]
MNTLVLACIAMVLLATNSLFTRAGVLDGTDPLAFAAIRVGAGAIVLGLLAARRGISVRGAQRWIAATALVTYLVGFSLAYRSLDAGLGALILFATVQLTLFGIALQRGEGTNARQIGGMALALGGLAWLLWPDGTTQTNLADAALMIVAGAAWGVYTLAGRLEPRPLAGSAGNFIAAAGVFVLLAPVWLQAPVTLVGAAMAVASGAVASGIGYAILFRVLPSMGSTTAGLMQLSVPVIAMGLGAVLLAEVPSTRAMAAAGLVLAGIAFATYRPRSA